MTLETVLKKFDRVKETAPGKYVACCPAHDDRTPSLGITETPEGKVLLNCRAGCPVESVLDSARLTFSALFPERSRHDRPSGPSRAQQTEINLALIVCEIAKTERARGVEHSANDLETIRKSVALLKTITPSQRKLSTPGKPSKILLDDEMLRQTVDKLRPPEVVFAAMAAPIEQSTAQWWQGYDRAAGATS